MEPISGIVIGGTYLDEYNIPELITKASDGFITFPFNFVKDGRTLRYAYNLEAVQDAFYNNPNLFVLIQETPQQVMEDLEYSRKGVEQIKRYAEVMGIPVFWFETWTAVTPFNGIVKKQNAICEEFGFIPTRSASMIEAFSVSSPYAFNFLEDFKTRPTLKASYLSAISINVYIQNEIFDGDISKISWDKDFELNTKHFPQKMRNDTHLFVERVVVKGEPVKDAKKAIHWSHR